MTLHSIVRSPAPRVESDRDIERSCSRDDDRRRKAGHQGRGDLGRGYTPRLPRGCGCGPSGQRSLGEWSVPTTANGYERLLCWAEGFGHLRCAGVEGTSSYGAGLVRHLKARGTEVLEMERTKRRPVSQSSDCSTAKAHTNRRRDVLLGKILTTRVRCFISWFSRSRPFVVRIRLQ